MANWIGMNYGRRKFIIDSAKGSLAVALASSFPLLASGVAQTRRIGFIGLDTSQVVMIMSHINNISGPGYDVIQPQPDRRLEGFKVVASYPYGSRNIASSIRQIPTYVDKMVENGVEVVNSLDELIRKVDAVALMTFDGHPRQEQAFRVIHAGKPLFINKPVAASLKQVIAIYDEANRRNVPIFSSSPTRYLKGAQAAAKGEIGEITGADTYSGAPLEPSHPDFFWYGVHGIEILFTVMGKGCLAVSRTSTPETDIVVGTWDNNRLGSYRGIRKGKATHGGTCFGVKDIISAGSFNDVGHRPLVMEMLQFFRTGKAPVSAEETIAIHAFMEAADESRRQHGKQIMLQTVIDRARA